MLRQYAWFVVLVMAASAAPPPMDEDMAELARMVRESCHAETGVDLKLVESVNAGATLMEDGKLACYVKCVMETAGMLDEDGVQLDVVLSLLDAGMRARNEPMLRACGTVRGADACDTAWRTQRCWQQGNPEDFYLI